jgi:hypothetical protein
MLDGVRGVPEASIAALTADGEWYWASNLLYVYSSTSPSGRTIEAAARQNSIDTSGQQYLVFNGLEVQHGNSLFSQGGITIAGAGHVTVQNCHAAYNAQSGISILDTAGPSISILNNELDHNNMGFITYRYAGAGSGTETLVSGNYVHNNDYIHPGAVYGMGIQVYGNHVIVQTNLVQNNGNAGMDTIGIHIVATVGSSTYGEYNTIRYNAISGQVTNTGDGAGIETDNSTANNDIYGNVIYGNYGPCLDLYESSANVYGNTCYNNLLNPAFAGRMGEIAISNVPDNLSITLNVKNNLLYATRPYSYGIYVDENSYNKTLAISNNLFYGTGQTNWYFWNATAGSNLASFNALAGVAANLNGSPLFTNAGSGDFALQSGSPAIGAGVYVPGASTANPPNIGAK